MRSLVKQLSCPQGGWQLRKEVVQVYGSRKQSGFASGSLVFTESLNLILSLVNTYSQTTIIVDALDECDPLNRDELLHSLGTIISNSSSLVKIFVSSRDDSDIVLRLEDIPNLSIRARDNEKDIQRFVRDEITRRIERKELLRGKVSEELKEKIINTVTEGSDGMYRSDFVRLFKTHTLTSHFKVLMGRSPNQTNLFYDSRLRYRIKARATSGDAGKDICRDLQANSVPARKQSPVGNERTDVGHVLMYTPFSR